jgi:hypothetical protein
VKGDEKGFSNVVNEQRPGLAEAANKSEIEELVKELRSALRSERPASSAGNSVKDP